LYGERAGDPSDPAAHQSRRTTVSETDPLLIDHEDPVPTHPDDAPDLGSSAVMTPEGWEVISYVEPGGDWEPTDDGGYEAPDGLTRSWSRAPDAEWSDATANEAD
jgi:hypothetical protein